MRTLSATLITAPRLSNAIPYVKVLIRNRIGAVQRLTFTRLYTGSEGDYYHSMTIPADGSMVRARVGANPFVDGLFVQRVASPGPSSDFATWASVVVPVSGGGTVVASSGTRVLHFWVSDTPWSVNGSEIYFRESTDSGATWGAAALVVDVDIPPTGDFVYHLAAAVNPAGDCRLFYASNYPYFNTMRKPSGGAWSAASALTWAGVTFLTIRGIAVAWDSATSKWNVLFTGLTSDNKMHLYSFTYDDAAGASALTDIYSTGASVTFRQPYLAKPDVWRFTMSESNPLANRLGLSHSLPSSAFLDNHWRELVPFNHTSQYGLAVASTSSYVWLSSAAGVWRSPIGVTDADVTSRVISLDQDVKPYGGGVKLELDNTDGYFAGFDYKGCELQISPGYKTTAGNEYSTGPSAYILGWEYVCEKTKASLVVLAGSHWDLMENIKSVRSIAWSSGYQTVYHLIQSVLAKAGLELTYTSRSSLATNLQPAFVIHPEQSLATALKRLLAIVQDVLYFREDKACMKNPLSTDASDYSYGSGSPPHSLFEGRFVHLAHPVNRAQVFTTGIVAEEFNWDEIGKVHDRLSQVKDLNMSDPTRATERAQAELREAEIAAASGSLSVPVNAGQELCDVVTITDSRWQSTGQLRRVRSLSLFFSTAESIYRQKITLGAR